MNLQETLPRISLSSSNTLSQNQRITDELCADGLLSEAAVQVALIKRQNRSRLKASLRRKNYKKQSFLDLLSQNRF